MIRISDVTEKRQSDTLSQSPAESNILPDRISTEEARGFWDSHFADSCQEEASEVYDDAWGEIFGRDEADFVFDFEIGNDIRSLLDKFDSAQWNELSDEERADAIKQFVAVLADRLGLDTAPNVAFFVGPQTLLGEYSHADNCVELNAMLLDQPDRLRTVIPHEMRHAYQYQKADSPKTWQDYLYRLNIDNYISPVSLPDGKYLFYTDYQDQLVEAETRAFAGLFSRKEAS